MNWIFLALSMALGPSWSAAQSKSSDALAVLEQNPSSAATERVGRMYRQTKDADARLWLVEALYGRVQQFHDEKALEILAEAAGDKSPNVRRKAIAGLEAVRFLPPGRGRESWIARVDSIAKTAGRDASPEVQAAGKDLRAGMHNWRNVVLERPQSPEKSSGEFSRWMVGSMPQVFVWVVCLQLIGYCWHQLGMGLLGRVGASGAAVLESISIFDRRPTLLAFPLMTGLFLLPTLGLPLAWTLVTAAMPSSEPMSWLRCALMTLAIYAAAGVACFWPALLLAGRLAAGLPRALGRSFGFVGLAELALLAWPLEPILRLRSERNGAGTLAWMARVGTPLAALLAARLMAEEGLGAVDALGAAARKFRNADRAPGAEFFGKAPANSAFALWCLASPLLFSLSLIPSILLGFKPTQLFGLWFLSNVQFSVGFGWWAGALLSVSAFGQLLVLGAVKAAEVHSKEENA